MLFTSLTNFWRSIKRDKFLLLALFVGLLLRGLNPTFGSPTLYASNDEAIAHLSALNMIASRTPVSIANYTPLGAYLQIPFITLSFLAMKLLGLVQNAFHFEIFVLTHDGYFLFIPRLISAFFGTLTILVIYKMTLELFKSKQTAIIAAFLAAVSFNLVHISHFGRPWAASVFFFILAVYLALKDKKILSPVSVAFSYGFHQVGILAFPLIFFKIFKRKLSGAFFGSMISVLLMAVFSFLTLRKGLVVSIANNQSFLLKGRLLADLLIGNVNLWDSFVRTLNENLSIYFLANLLFTDGIILLFGLIGIFLCLRVKRAHNEIIFYVVFYYLFASLFFHPLIRYLLPILLLLIPYSAWAIHSVFNKSSLLIVAILLFASINSIWWNYLFIQKPTFISASEWISKKIPADVPIYYIGGRFQTFAPNADAIRKVQIVNKGFDSRLLGLLDDNNSADVRNIIYVSNFPGKGKLEQLLQASDYHLFGFVVDYYLDPKDRIYNLNPNLFEIVNQFKPARNEEVTRISEPLFDASWNFFTSDFKNKISMYGLLNTGPYVDILLVKDSQQR